MRRKYRPSGQTPSAIIGRPVCRPAQSAPVADKAITLPQTAQPDLASGTASSARVCLPPRYPDAVRHNREAVLRSLRMAVYGQMILHSLPPSSTVYKLHWSAVRSCTEIRSDVLGTVLICDRVHKLDTQSKTVYNTWKYIVTHFSIRSYKVRGH